MKFIIFRTSGYFEDVEKLEDLRLDLNEYNVSLESKINRCEKEKTYAVIEINSLEDLIKLTKKYQQIVLNAGETSCVKGMPDLEIYDTWRE